MRRFLNRLVGVGFYVAPVAFLFLAGCDPKDAANAKAVADAAAASPNPLLMAIGTLASSLIGSHFISKANDTKADGQPWTDDDAHAMADKLTSMGYVITKKPAA